MTATFDGRSFGLKQGLEAGAQGLAYQMRKMGFGSVPREDVVDEVLCGDGACRRRRR